jgi:hypothetical protein
MAIESHLGGHPLLNIMTAAFPQLFPLQSPDPTTLALPVLLLVHPFLLDSARAGVGGCLLSLDGANAALPSDASLCLATRTTGACNGANGFSTFALANGVGLRGR